MRSWVCSIVGLGAGFAMRTDPIRIESDYFGLRPGEVRVVRIDRLFQSAKVQWGQALVPFNQGLLQRFPRAVCWLWNPFGVVLAQILLNARRLPKGARLNFSSGNGVDDAH